ncbi:putative nitrate reductase [Aspergillus foveolatus]|uniref:putative nitrate reductase n=1 Tax=Aspergillus foveolatus TaxID=210207 RepID=UPI003CCD6CC5
MPPATELDIFNEPDWTKTHSHRVGLRSRDDRFPGLTHSGDDWRFVLEEEAEEKITELKRKVERGELLTVRDFLAKQQDFHLQRPKVHPQNWRYVLHTSENHIKEEQPWLINDKKKEKKEEEKKAKESRGKNAERKDSKLDGQDTQGKESNEDQGSKAEEEEKKGLSPEEKELLELLRDEEAHMRSLKQNTGQGQSPAKSDFLPAEIDEIDQMTPDNWIPRTDHLIRITGKHPLNAEPVLTELFDAGLITPNWLHYVRSHGSVPHLLWENHKLEISAGENMTLLMDDLKDQFESINIPVFVACDGNRRKELNMIKRSKGFNWGPAAVGCAYWRGVRLRDVLKQAGIKALMNEYSESRLWVNFQGAETLSEGKYETCLPLEYVMDKRHDVLLAYEMNDSPLPPDHGYPLRLVVPGYVGGRWVKWLEKVWVTDKENDSHYHIWDNRVVPESVTDKESELAETAYRNPSTACMEQVLNSILVRPGPEEKIDLDNVKKGKKYRIQGFAYNGGGNEIQRVEISLDEGASWLYCARRVRHLLAHGRGVADRNNLLRANSIRVRCWDVNKNAQPEHPTWNLEGMMNNCHYIVKSDIVEDEESGKTSIIFRHPCEPATGEGGWMKPSAQIQAEESQRQASTPGKQFTREEIEKHSTEDDCWIVVNGNVYDATGVMSWHPGGKAPIMAHAGRVHQDTTNEFESIHDNFANSKLQECILGTVTKKAKDFMQQEAKVKAKQRASSSKQESQIALKRHKWTQARFVRKTPLSEDTNRYTFELLAKTKKLGLQTGQHIQIGFHFKDQLVFRSYTPVKPIMEEEEDGTFDLIVKTYYPDPGQPGGTMSNILDCLAEGEEVEIKGPAGEIVYKGNGTFKIDDKERTFERITLVLGGSGVTPGYQVIAKILLSDGRDKTKIRVIDGNRTENDILLRKELQDFAEKHPEQFQITHVLSHAGDDWKGERGHVSAETLHKFGFEPDEKSVALLCGPPAMIQKAVLPALVDWGYDQDNNLFGF